MTKVKVGIPQGTRDFPAEVVKREHILLIPSELFFELYGFSALETPAMENLETLMGKYGDEGDRLIFKILNNGLDNLQNISRLKKILKNCWKAKCKINYGESTPL